MSINPVRNTLQNQNIPGGDPFETGSTTQTSSVVAETLLSSRGSLEGAEGNNVYTITMPSASGQKTKDESKTEVEQLKKQVARGYIEALGKLLSLIYQENIFAIQALYNLIYEDENYVSKIVESADVYKKVVRALSQEQRKGNTVAGCILKKMALECNVKNVFGESLPVVLKQIKRLGVSSEFSDTDALQESEIVKLPREREQNNILTLKKLLFNLSAQDDPAIYIVSGLPIEFVEPFVNTKIINSLKTKAMQPNYFSITLLYNIAKTGNNEAIQAIKEVAQQKILLAKILARNFVEPPSGQSTTKPAATSVAPPQAMETLQPLTTLQNVMSELDYGTP